MQVATCEKEGLLNISLLLLRYVWMACGLHECRASVMGPYVLGTRWRKYAWTVLVLTRTVLLKYLVRLLSEGTPMKTAWLSWDPPDKLTLPSRSITGVVTYSASKSCMFSLSLRGSTWARGPGGTTLQSGAPGGSSRWERRTPNTDPSLSTHLADKNEAPLGQQEIGNWYMLIRFCFIVYSRT